MDDPLLPPPTELLVISGETCRQMLDIAALRGALADALRAHSEGQSSVPPRIAAWTDSGLLGAMPGNVAGTGLGAKLVSVFPHNHGTSVPSHQGLITLFDQDNGRPLAVMEGAYITAIRTAASAAVAADLAARADAAVLAIIGAGVQGHAHAQAFAGIRQWSEVRVASRTAANAEELAERAGATQCSSFEEAVRGADVVALCTDAGEPVIRSDWLAPGVHVSSVGVGREIDDATMALADRIIVEWRGAAENAPPAGSHELQALDPLALIEVGEIVAGRAEGRASNAEITVYKSTGHAVEDIAAAALVYERARAAGAGIIVSI